MARPREITDELLTSARDWLTERSDIGTDTLLPTIEGLALHVKISRETVYDWEDKGKLPEATETEEAFSDIVRELRAAQAEKLMQNSLQGRYNPMISKLLLSKHGYVEKSEQDITSKGEQITNPVSKDQIDTFLESVKDATKQK